MSKGFFSFLGGAIAGAAAALLLAPKTGKETREEVKKVIEQAEEYLKKNADFILEEGKKQIDKIVAMTSAEQEKTQAKKETKSTKKSS